MARRDATVDRLLPRRRIGGAEMTALVAAAFALAMGAAAWLTSESSAMQTPGDVLSFEERFLPPATSQSFHAERAPQAIDRSALARFEARLRDAKGLLSERLLSSDWRGALDAIPPETAPKPSVVTDIPLPRSRPAAADMQVATDNAPTPAPPPRAESRSMLQKLSDMMPGKLTLASLTPFQRGPDLAALGYDSQTAVYDISAHAVYLPSGLTLEAHSGMGPLKDDPDHVDQHMVGATPPTTYDLKPRERLFHNVKALRMIPVEANSTLGRAGLLVHSYMLGPDGDSNGCVSIRDYERFRKAYEDGEIARIVVVPSLSATQTAQHGSSPS
jgi:hypothetical protein